MSRNNNSKENSKFNPFSWMNRDGAGVDEREAPVMDEPGVKNYFKLFWRKLSQIVSVNLMMLLCNFPVFFALAVLTGYFSIHSSAPTYSIFAQISGAMNFEQNAFTSALIGTFGAQSDITVLSNVDYVLLALSVLAIFTFGPVMTGCTYLLRNMVKEDPTFLWHDFITTVKKNIKQSLVFGIIDVIVMALIAYDVLFFNLNYSKDFVTSMMFFASLVLAVLYSLMRYYIYLMMVTFDLPLGKMFKNALLFTVLGVKRNAMAILATMAIVGIDIVLFVVYMPLGIILPFVILFSMLAYTGVYCAYPVIYKYMIEPYYNKDGTPKAPSSSRIEEGE